MIHRKLHTAVSRASKFSVCRTDVRVYIIHTLAFSCRNLISSCVPEANEATGPSVSPATHRVYVPVCVVQ